ncbi:MAG TPA: hydroxymethylbilane synthase, partial [Micromonosporaceae bacterium]
MTLRLGTRGSALAMAQSGLVADAVRAATGLDVELVEIVTSGDRSSAPVARLGVGVFVSALRDALAAKDIDFAVHSFKDLPTGAADGLAIVAVPPREDPRDALIARDGLTLAGLPAGSRIGTGAVRRIAAIRALGLPVEIVPIRGNVDTRLRKVANGELDAVILARAGLARLGRAGEITEILDPELIMP